MEREQIKEQVIAIVEDKLGLDKGDASEESNVHDDLGADSLDAVEIIMDCENDFGIRIPDDESEGIETVKDLIDLVEKTLTAKN